MAFLVEFGVELVIVNRQQLCCCLSHKFEAIFPWAPLTATQKVSFSFLPWTPIQSVQCWFFSTPHFIPSETLFLSIWIKVFDIRLDHSRQSRSIFGDHQHSGEDRPMKVTCPTTFRFEASVKSKILMNQPSNDPKLSSISLVCTVIALQFYSVWWRRKHYRWQSSSLRAIKIFLTVSICQPIIYYYCEKIQNIMNDVPT